MLHDDKEVKKETILAIRDLVIFEASAEIMQVYPRETDNRIKISMLKTLSVIGDDTVKNFAIGLLDTEEDLDVKFEIVNCIHKIEPNYFNFLKKEKQECSIVEKMILHLNSPYLN